LEQEAQCIPRRLVKMAHAQSAELGRLASMENAIASSGWLFYAGAVYIANKEPHMTEVNFPHESDLTLEDDGVNGMALQAAVAITTAVIAKGNLTPDHETLRALFRNIATDAKTIMAKK